MPDHNDPKFWMARAEETRAMAESLIDTDAREQLLGIVQGYKRLAALAQQRKLAASTAR